MCTNQLVCCSGGHDRSTMVTLLAEEWRTMCFCVQDQPVRGSGGHDRITIVAHLAADWGTMCFCVQDQPVCGSGGHMDEGWERDKTSRKGGLPTLPSLKLSTFQPSQWEFFWVHTCVWRERKPEAEFSNFSGPQASIPQYWQIGFGNSLSSCYTRTTIWRQNWFFGNVCTF